MAGAPNNITHHAKPGQADPQPLPGYKVVLALALIAFLVFAADGAEAIRLFKAAMNSGRPFTAAILDLTIAGGMGGRETVSDLLKLDPGVRAIVSSGYADDPVIAKYRDYGFSAVVAKPYTLKQLGTALKSVIN